MGLVSVVAYNKIMLENIWYQSHTPAIKMMTESASPLTGGSTSVLERTEAQKDPGDNERYAHYVRKDKITASAVTGQAVIALCGKVWVPKGDPKNHPICPACKEIMKSMSENSSNGWPFFSDSNS